MTTLLLLTLLFGVHSHQPPPTPPPTVHVTACPAWAWLSDGRVVYPHCHKHAAHSP